MMKQSQSLIFARLKIIPRQYARRHSLTKLHLLILLAGLLSLNACGDSAARYNNQGNESFEAEQYDESLEKYTSSQLEDPDRAAPYYNAGNAHYRKDDLESAMPQLKQSLRSIERSSHTTEDELAQHSFYNLGNTYFKAQDWPAAIQAYQEALRLNPDDMDAKHNLELALQMQQQQQQQDGGQSGQQGGQSDQQQDQDGQGQQQGGQEQRQDGQPQQDQQPDQNQGQGEQDDNQNNSGGGGNQGQNQQDQDSGGLSKEEAEQLLDALGQDSQTLQERLQQKHGASGSAPNQDW